MSKIKSIPKADVAVNIYSPNQYIVTTIVDMESGHITKAQARAWFWGDILHYLILGVLYILLACCYGVGFGLLISLLQK